MKGYELTVFALLRVAFHHLVTILEAREGHLSDRVLFVCRLVSRQERCIGSKREMDTGETKVDENQQVRTSL